jgi:hypothetical protein
MERNSNSAIAGIFSKLCNCRNNPRPSRPASCKSAQVDSPVRHPDLAIYSQPEEITNGNVPSWDSPDIVSNNWRPFRLNPETNVKVRNVSSVAAINSLVHFYTSPFGIGTRKELKLTKVITLGAGQEMSLDFPLDQQTLAGDQRIGVHILLEHPHDEHLINNSGSQVHEGAYTTESGRSFSVQIPVLNDYAGSRQIFLQIMPTDLLCTLTPVNHLFGAFEQIIATLHITVPAFLSGSATTEINRGVTVVAKTASGELVGGVTRLLRIDN